MNIKNGDSAVLVIIDLQEKLMRVMPDRETVVNNTLILMELARQFDIPVIVTEQYPKGLGPTLAEIKDKLKDHLLLEKITFSAGQDLIENLRKLGRNQIIVAGSETHVCVFQTVRDLLANDFAVQVPKDAVCSRRILNYENGLDLMKEKGAVITNTETLVFEVLYQAGTPEFKVMSPLIKNG
ncbi:MAG: isochorismatase family protein [Syntrophomonadaceae bacterium]|nr:isochorismatase family protein [Syntrophomonadaceae bacterium]